MSTKYPGGFITKSPVAPTSSAASGVWTLDQALQYTKAGTWPTPSAFVNDVFSAYTYTGNGSTQTITNGIDLAGKGGMTWLACRSAPNGHIITDTVRGVSGNSALQPSSTSTGVLNNLSGFNSNGFALNNANLWNTNAATYVAWTFRKAAKFFDVVTFTAGATNVINHSLGTSPGMVIIKCTGASEDWLVYHSDLGAGKFLKLNGTNAEISVANLWAASSTTFTWNASNYAYQVGQPYVAYLFAHDTDTTNGIIQCGSFTTGGTGKSTINLGWEPQFVLIKPTSTTGDWKISDVARGAPVDSAGSSQANLLWPNLSSAESLGAGGCTPTATGFFFNPGVDQTYIYLAIRRPNKPPTTGTQVFAIDTRGAGSPAFVAGFAPDMITYRDKTGSDWYSQSRLTAKYLLTNSTAAESAFSIGAMDYPTGWLTGSGSSLPNLFSYMFYRAPGVFDVVCYTGTGSATTTPHSLGVVPELIIIKNRSAAAFWPIWATGFATTVNNGDSCFLNDTAAKATGYSFWNGAHTSSAITLGIDNRVNASSNTYVAYLFATKAGISKVGSYTGNGSTQTINCGFTTGARFVMIKRTDSTGDWYVWDSTRGIVAGNDPHLSLNTTAAEVTTDDSVDTDTSGFIVNQLAATNINVTSATYIYLSFA